MGGYQGQESSLIDPCPEDDDQVRILQVFRNGQGLQQVAVHGRAGDHQNQGQGYPEDPIQEIKSLLPQGADLDPSLLPSKKFPQRADYREAIS
jgi:hypothetical protein